MWGLEVVLDCMFVGYIALLIRARNLKAEKNMNLRFLHSSTPVSVHTGQSPALSLSVLESVLNGISAL